MAILLATLVLVVLASPVAEMTSQALLIVVGATLVFLLSCLQQVDAHPRLRAPTRLIVLLWLALNLLLPWSEPTLGLAAAALAVLNLIVLWLVAQHLIHADHVDAELLCGAVGPICCSASSGPGRTRSSVLWRRRHSPRRVERRRLKARFSISASRR